MTEDLNTDKIAHLLTQNTARMDADTLSALSKAHRKALQRQSARDHVYAHGTGRWAHLLLSFSNHHLLSAGLLAAALFFGVSYWHQSHEQQIAELDAAILTDDLPIEVFVD